MTETAINVHGISTVYIPGSKRKRSPYTCKKSDEADTDTTLQDRHSEKNTKKTNCEDKWHKTFHAVQSCPPNM